MTHDEPHQAEARRSTRPDSLRRRIYLDLRSRLQRCAVGPDDRLIDLEVAKSYGTSRMPAREALLQLVHEGYLIGTTRGFMVPRLSVDDVRDIFEVRRLLEPRAAALAARDLDADHAAELDRARAAARAAAEAEDVEALILANIDFRAAWLDAVRNRRLRSTIARFIDHVQAVRLGTLQDAGTRRTVAQGLDGLHDAFVRRDPVAAADRMLVFIVTAEQAFFARPRSTADIEATPDTRKVANV